MFSSAVQGYSAVIPLSIYLGSLAFGGVLLVASAFGGHSDGADGGGGGGHDHGGGADHDASHPPPAQAILVPFLSLRFWTFALAFFGLTGAALTAVGAGLGIAVPLLSGGVGVGAGYGASRILGALSRKSVGLLGPASSHIGREGKQFLKIVQGTKVAHCPP